MQLLDVSEKSKERKKGQRRIDLFRRENLETWILIFPPGDVQRMHNHPSDRTYYVLTGKGIMKGLNETHEVSAGQIISIPAHEFYEGSNPHDEPMIYWATAIRPQLKTLPKPAASATRSTRRPASASSTSMAAARTWECWRTEL